MPCHNLALRVEELLERLGPDLHPELLISTRSSLCAATCLVAQPACAHGSGRPVACAPLQGPPTPPLPPQTLVLFYARTPGFYRYLLQRRLRRRPTDRHAVLVIAARAAGVWRLYVADSGLRLGRVTAAALASYGLYLSRRLARQCPWLSAAKLCFVRGLRLNAARVAATSPPLRAGRLCYLAPFLVVLSVAAIWGSGTGSDFVARLRLLGRAYARAGLLQERQWLLALLRGWLCPEFWPISAPYGQELSSFLAQRAKFGTTDVDTCAAKAIHGYPHACASKE